MNPAVIDTLKFADRLKNAGFPPPQAEGLARALGDELGERMVTKRDLDDAVQTLNATIGILDAKFESKFEAMDQKFEAMDQKFEAMETKFDSKFLALAPRFDAIDAKLESQHREYSTRFNVLFGTMALGFTLLIALIGYTLFSPRLAEPPSPAVEPRVADAPAWQSPGPRELS
ncbi:MAG: hypothetical protein OXK76_10715 [Gammaproteobacteria bacterium]|nr:hypothetical protein [Gammaproteobacteria bacterium]